MPRPRSPPRRSGRPARTARSTRRWSTGWSARGHAGGRRTDRRARPARRVARRRGVLPPRPHPVAGPVGRSGRTGAGGRPPRHARPRPEPAVPGAVAGQPRRRAGRHRRPSWSPRSRPAGSRPASPRSPTSSSRCSPCPVPTGGRSRCTCPRRAPTPTVPGSPGCSARSGGPRWPGWRPAGRYDDALRAGPRGRSAVPAGTRVAGRRHPRCVRAVDRRRPRHPVRPPRRRPGRSSTGGSLRPPARWWRGCWSRTRGPRRPVPSSGRRARCPIPRPTGCGSRPSRPPRTCAPASATHPPAKPSSSACSPSPGGATSPPAPSSAASTSPSPGWPTCWATHAAARRYAAAAVDTAGGARHASCARPGPPRPGIRLLAGGRRPRRP